MEIKYLLAKPSTRGKGAARDFLSPGEAAAPLWVKLGVEVAGKGEVAGPILLLE